MAKLQKFSEVAKDGCCPNCGYAVMKRGANAVTGNLGSAWPQQSLLAACSVPLARRSSAAAAEPSTCRADRTRRMLRPGCARSRALAR